MNKPCPFNENIYICINSKNNAEISKNNAKVVRIKAQSAYS